MANEKAQILYEKTAWRTAPASRRFSPLGASLLLVVVDYVALVAAVWAAYFSRASLLPEYFGHAPFTVADTVFFSIVPLVFLLFMQFDRLYTARLLFWQMTEKLFKISIYAVLLIVGLLYFTGVGKEISRIFIFLLWLYSFGFAVIGRYLAKKALIMAGAWQKPALLLGAGQTGELLFRAFRDDGGLGYNIVGLIEDRPRVAASFKGCPLLGSFAEAEKIIARTGVKELIVAAPGLERTELVGLIQRLQPLVNNITFVPDLFGVPVASLELETLFNEKTILLRVRNNLAYWYNSTLKLVFDNLASLAGMIVILPVCAVIAAAIKLDSPGPIFFAHQRIGRDGKTFPCYKFRTMAVNAQELLEKYLASDPAIRQEWERDFKLKDDPRVTRVGRFLRKTSLDELPQIFNVLRGEMSLVGPRPIIKDEIAKYGDYINDFYLVRPGITGLWQVSGRSDVDYENRVQLDSWYVRNWSLWLDMMLLMRTVGVVVRGKGAY